jgi:hypothetical protein
VQALPSQQQQLQRQPFITLPPNQRLTYPATDSGFQPPASQSLLSQQTTPSVVPERKRKAKGPLSKSVAFAAPLDALPLHSVSTPAFTTQQEQTVSTGQHRSFSPPAQTSSGTVSISHSYPPQLRQEQPQYRSISQPRAAESQQNWQQEGPSSIPHLIFPISYTSDNPNPSSSSLQQMRTTYPASVKSYDDIAPSYLYENDKVFPPERKKTKKKKGSEG